MRDRIISMLLLVSLMFSLALTGCSSSKSATNSTDADKNTANSADSTLQPTEPEVTEPVETPERKAVNMLNYITVLTAQINASSNSRRYLDSVKSSLQNNLALSAIDDTTQEQINNLWETIDTYGMISVEQERLAYLYEQSKAQAIKNALPHPINLNSFVQAGSGPQIAATVLYMAVDSAASYKQASTEIDLEYAEYGWELEDEETSALSESQQNLLNYMIDMAQENELPDEWVLKPETVEDFAKWTSSDLDNLASKINWLKENEETYQEFRTYWLELAKCYYEAGEFQACLDSIARYEGVAVHIFDKDLDYAKALPAAILSAQETMGEAEYITYADKYAAIILENCDNEDWALRYFTAQIYIDLYSRTEDRAYLEEAYRITFNNVNVLAYEQKALNQTYLEPVKETEIKKDASERLKEETKAYNEMLTEKRKTELPPVNEFFYLNCELLFVLIEELNMSDADLETIDETMRGTSGEHIFLTDTLDNRFWASKDITDTASDDIAIEFDGEKLTIPANYLTERYSVTVSTSGGTVLDDWEVEKVKRPKDSTTCSEFMATLISKTAKEYAYAAGETITISILPIEDATDDAIVCNYNVIETKTLGIFGHIEFEQATAE